MAGFFKNIVGGFLDTSVGRLNLQEENAGGFFPNITMLSMLLLNLAKNRPSPRTKRTFKKEYDFVIVGAGSAGSVLANRLSELSCVDVLLLEAGAEAPFLTEVPATSRIFYGSKIDWAYKTEPQEFCADAHDNKQVIWNSGKALGGSSVLNAMLYVRGNRKNYDQWAKEGAEGWSYDDVLPYFKKLEDNQNIDQLDKGYHATGGPMTAERPNYTPNFKNPVIEALESFGFAKTDPNGKRQTGIYEVQGTLRDGFRCSTAKAYLVPAENRPNLDILKGAFVTKILIEGKVAQGVEFDFRGRRRTVRARREVVISSGSVRTPQILMLSGIGPKEELREHKIDMVVDLPVGENLQDHYSTYLPYLMDPKAGNLLLRYFNPVNLYRFINDRAGPLAAPCQVSLIAFLDGLNKTSNSRDFPKIELYFADYDTFDPKRNYNLKKEEYDRVFGPYEGKAMYACLVSLTQPKSRGRITLKSTNPYDHPRIDPRYYEDDEDMENIIEGMKVCHAVATSDFLKKGIQSSPLNTTFSECEEFQGDQEAQFRCHAKSLVLTFWHPVGTARMGDPKDPRSVVDPELRVIGVKGLRVVNAAVMPIVPSGNTNIPTIMIAEKAADIMKQEVDDCEDDEDD